MHHVLMTATAQSICLWIIEQILDKNQMHISVYISIEH